MRNHGKRHSNFPFGNRWSHSSSLSTEPSSRLGSTSIPSCPPACQFAHVPSRGKSCVTRIESRLLSISMKFRPEVEAYSLRDKISFRGFTTRLRRLGTRPRDASSLPGRTQPSRRWYSPSSSHSTSTTSPPPLPPPDKEKSSTSNNSGTSERNVLSSYNPVVHTQRTRHIRAASKACVSGEPSQANSLAETGFCKPGKVSTRVYTSSPSLWDCASRTQSCTMSLPVSVSAAKSGSSSPMPSVGTPSISMTD
mmetsp:Transcript_6821/g.12656  ORF Transcript_6821/g.12656 Transcript_6821/m.12656 type:complete len:251 (+) Transcript_6821:114-866(+)